MILGGKFNFTYILEEEEDGEDLVEVLLDVSGTISDAHDAVMHQRNGDPGWPAEGGEVEDLTVIMPGGVVMNPIPDELYETLCERALDENRSRGSW